MSEEQTLRNAAKPVLTGWPMFWASLSMAEGGSVTYRDPAFLTCPECGSPNVRQHITRRNKPGRWQCPERDCKSKGDWDLAGSTGIERHRAIVRQRLILVAFLGLLVILSVTGNLPSGG